MKLYTPPLADIQFLLQAFDYDAQIHAIEAFEDFDQHHENRSPTGSPRGSKASPTLLLQVWNLVALVFESPSCSFGHFS